MADQKRRKSDTRFVQFVTKWAPVYVAASVTLLVLLSVLSIVNAGQINKNTHRIQQGLTRVCERENPIRAEVHLVYGTRTARPTKKQLAQARATEPLLTALLQAQVGQLVEAQKRTRTGLPILDCTGNLHGGGAKVLSRRDQDIYVRAYEHKRLNPITGLPRR